MPKHVNQLGAALAVALAPGLLAACAGDVINLGEREDEVAVPAYSRCQSSTTLEGSVRVESQEQLDALEGCKVIAGDFDVVAYPAADLRALNALTRVEGYVQIGGHLPVRDENDGLTLEEWWAQHDAYEASIVDWLPSLEGLERLESVDSLIVKASVPSLQPLSGLRRINTGLLQVSSNVLESLAGLEHLRGIESLSIDGAELRDVSALRLPETMGSLLVHAPIDALDAAELKQLLSLDLAYTELENLDVFSSLENVDRVSIVGNARLRDMAGFDGVNTIGDLFLQGNAALERMGDFASLTSRSRTTIACPSSHACPIITSRTSCCPATGGPASTWMRSSCEATPACDTWSSPPCGTRPTRSGSSTRRSIPSISSTCSRSERSSSPPTPRSPK